MHIESKFKNITLQVEPFVPLIARILLVSTFIEDSFRIMFQWKDQFYYFHNFKKFPAMLTYVLLITSVVIMMTSSISLILKKNTVMSCSGLVLTMFMQSAMYNLILNVSFMTKMLSLMGGLLILVSDSMQKSKKLNGMFAGLPSLDTTEKRHYVSLFGRVLLILVFTANTVSSKQSTFQNVMAVVCLALCFLIVIGFKAKYSAIFLLSTLFLINLFLNDYWLVASNSPMRDLKRYDFFMTMSLIGGLLLLINNGPGKLSLEKEKKNE